MWSTEETGKMKAPLVFPLFEIFTKAYFLIFRFKITDPAVFSFLFFFCDLRIHNISGEASYINSASLSDKQGRGIFIREHSCEASRSLIPLHLKDDVEATVRRAIRGRAGGALSVFTKGSTYCVWRWTYRCISNWPTEDTRGVCM